jgi:hypothetical protein
MPHLAVLRTSSLATSHRVPPFGLPALAIALTSLPVLSSIRFVNLWHPFTTLLDTGDTRSGLPPPEDHS